MKLSIIIPVFNEEKTIGNVLEKFETLEIPKVDFEIIVVNDGSRDKTKEEILKFKKKIKNLLVLDHEVNIGKGAAVKTGIAKATGEYILIQDADGEYNTEYIPIMLEPIQKGISKVVFGTRLNRLPNIFKEERKPLFLLHYIGNRFLSLFTSILYKQWITDMETGYKVFPKSILNNASIQAKSFDFEPEITAKILKSGYSITEIPITTTPRGYSEGKKLHAVKDGIMALKTLIKYKFTDK